MSLSCLKWKCLTRRYFKKWRENINDERNHMMKEGYICNVALLKISVHSVLLQISLICIKKHLLYSIKNFTQSPELRIVLPEKSWVIFLNGNCSQICFPKYTLKERLKMKISYSYVRLQNRVTKFKLQNQVAKFSYAKWRALRVTDTKIFI